ncbi:MAG: hypothetical protein WC693_05655 [Patescibacteria group bacterium]|jgi:hypothetical protein
MIYKKVLTILLWGIKIAALGVSVMLFVMVFNKYFVPLGKLEVVYDFSEGSDYISKLEPWQRLLPPEEINGDWSQAMKDDLVYFDVKIPRWFQTVTAEITFQNDAVPILEIGARADSAGNYLSKPLQNKLIDLLDWKKETLNQTTLYQKDDKYADVQSFITRPPIDEMVGEYFYSLEKNKIIPDYQKSRDKTVIDSSLRGSHTLYTYLKDEDLNFSFGKFDLNWYAGPDTVTVDVYRQSNGEKIYTAELSDDGETGITGIYKSNQNLSVIIPNLAEGVYRMEIRGSDDTVISRISADQHLIVFGKSLFLMDNQEYFKTLAPGSKPTKLITASSVLNFKTSHPAGLQKVLVGAQTVNIDLVNKDFNYQNNSGLVQISVPNNDLNISYNGFMAFTRNQYFNPLPDNISGINGNTDINSLDYIITDYTSPKNEGGWMMNTATFDLNRLYKTDNDNIRFRISAPQLSGTGEVIKISQIKISYEKPPLTLQSLPNKIKSYLSKLFTKN